MTVEEDLEKTVWKKCFKKHVKKQLHFLPFVSFYDIRIIYVCKWFSDAWRNLINLDDDTAVFFEKCETVKGEQVWIYSNPITQIDYTMCWECLLIQALTFFYFNVVVYFFFLKKKRFDMLNQCLVRSKTKIVISYSMVLGQQSLFL